MDDHQDLKGKRIIVSGLGRAIVEALIARGANVTTVARNETELGETVC